MISFECKRCGKCCKGALWFAGWYTKLIKPSDVDRWKAQDRNDILKYVCPTCNTLIDPDENNAPWMRDKCPFLEFEDGKAKCRIYDTRPQTCRVFPLAECNDPKCSKSHHFHQWLLDARCSSSKKFRDDMEQALMSQVRIQGKTIHELLAR